MSVEDEVSSLKALVKALISFLGFNEYTILERAEKDRREAEERRAESAKVREEIARDQAEAEREYKRAFGIADDFKLSKNHQNEMGVR